MSVEQAQQLPLVYPVSETNPPTHRQSDGGSFGAVFIVLAVIVAVSAIACFLGRMCNKRHNKSKPSKHNRAPKEKDMKPSRNAFQTKDGDIEFGFDKRFSSAKVAANGEPKMGRPNSGREQNMGPHMGRPNSFKEPSMGRPDTFREPSMGRPDSFREPSMGRPDSFREQSMGRPDSFREPSVGRPNSFRNHDHEMNFKSGTGPHIY